jgi:diguanylate cyclase (GGDEF)-like protein
MTPPPGSAGADGGSRDWAGLKRHVVSHVRDDRAAVSRSICDLQDAVWLVVDGLSQAIVGDDASDASAASQLQRLRAATGGSAAELKATALETVQRLSEIIDEKSTRQREMARELGERVDVLSVELADTRREADIDQLTRLGNRGVFQRELPRVVQVRALVHEPACLAMVDIDHFKQINDVHGHQFGDRVLQTVAERLQDSTRDSDTVARFGGDEFVVLLEDLAGPQEVVTIAERVRSTLGDPVRVEEHEIEVTASIGIARTGEADERADDLLSRADKAMYRAKEQGRNQIRLEPDPAGESLDLTSEDNDEVRSPE